MKIINSLAILLAATLASSAFAGTDYSKSSKAVEPMSQPCDPWAPGFAIGAFGGGILPRMGSDHYAGGGVLAEYFFNDYFGIQGDYGVYAYHSERHQFDGNFILRYPIRSCNIAPYIIAGGSYSNGGASEAGFETGWQSLGAFQAGAGFELRFANCNHIGIFADGTYHWDASHFSRDFTLVRLGVKYTF
jgi:hypothetical protein